MNSEIILKVLNGNMSPICYILLTILLVVIFFRKKKTFQNLPPGPYGVPVFGNLLQLRSRSILDVFTTYRQQYGDVFKVQLGSCLLIVVNGYDAIKDVFQHRGDEFSNRPNNFFNSCVLKHLGIVSGNNESWRLQRAFATSTLRHFGVGKRNIEVPIREESECLIYEIAELNGKTFEIKTFIQHATANIICKIGFGQRYDYGDKKFLELAHTMDEFVKIFSSVAVINAFPIARLLPFDLFGQTKTKSIYEKFLSYMRIQVEEHKRTIDVTDPRDLIDFYLIEASKHKDKTDSAFTDDQLIHVLTDFFIAGTETTATTFCWATVYLLNFPEIQKNLHNEIDLVLGSNEPKMENKKEMPCMAAFLEEVQRRSTVTPFAFEHAPSNDTTIAGFFIPKDAVIIPNLYSVSFDPNIFTDPEQFSPERFLDEDGNFHSNEKNIPFSIGRRVCLGESLAKTELFLFVTSILQHFEILEGDEGKPSLEPVLGAACVPAPFTMRAVSRK